MNNPPQPGTDLLSLGHDCARVDANEVANNELLGAACHAVETFIGDDKVLEAALLNVARVRVDRKVGFSGPGLGYLSDDIRDVLRLRIPTYERELGGIIALDFDGKIIDVVCLSQGTLDQVVIFAREIVDTALRLKAKSIVVWHSHPGRSAIPSYEDLLHVLSIQHLPRVQIELRDYCIISRGGEFFSAADLGILNDREKLAAAIEIRKVKENLPSSYWRSRIALVRFAIRFAYRTFLRKSFDGSVR